MKASMKPIRNEFPWGTIEWLANDEVGNSRELSLARMTLPPGKGTDTHIHANCEESIYVVRGEVECRIGEDRVQIEGGRRSRWFRRARCTASATSATRRPRSSCPTRPPRAPSSWPEARAGAAPGPRSGPAPRSRTPPLRKSR